VYRKEISFLRLIRVTPPTNNIAIWMQPLHAALIWYQIDHVRGILPVLSIIII